jgi:hypothetical protein
VRLRDDPQVPWITKEGDEKTRFQVRSDDRAVYSLVWYTQPLQTNTSPHWMRAASLRRTSVICKPTLSAQPTQHKAQAYNSQG